MILAIDTPQFASAAPNLLFPAPGSGTNALRAPRLRRLLWFLLFCCASTFLWPTSRGLPRLRLLLLLSIHLLVILLLRLVLLFGLLSSRPDLLPIRILHGGLILVVRLRLPLLSTATAALLLDIELARLLHHVVARTLDVYGWVAWFGILLDGVAFLRFDRDFT